jgi:hypothetical protein
VWKKAATVSFAACQTFKFKVVVDLTARTFDVFVTNPKTGVTTKITNAYALANSATSLNNFVKMNANGGTIVTSTPTFA